MTLVETVEILSEEEAHALLDEIRVGLTQTYHQLLRAERGRIWIPLGYGSLRECIMAELGVGQSRAYQLLDAARVQEAVEAAANSTDVETISEAAARDIKPVLTEATTEIAERVQAGEEPATVVPEVIERSRERGQQVREEAKAERDARAKESLEDAQRRDTIDRALTHSHQHVREVAKRYRDRKADLAAGSKAVSAALWLHAQSISDNHPAAVRHRAVEALQDVALGRCDHQAAIATVRTYIAAAHAASTPDPTPDPPAAPTSAPPGTAKGSPRADRGPARGQERQQTNRREPKPSPEKRAVDQTRQIIRYAGSWPNPELRIGDAVGSLLQGKPPEQRAIGRRHFALIRAQCDEAIETIDFLDAQERLQ